MSNTPRTRYPGLSSFTTAQKDIFFGRKQETRDLFNLVSVERTVVLFSKSGYGKTSLLQAGVMPLLYGQRLVPVPIRFGTDAIAPEWHFKLQFDEAHRRFLGKDDKQNEAIAEGETFWEQIRRSPFGAAPAQFTPLLIFDQFEELFTLYPDKQRRERFVMELADLIQAQMPESLNDHLLERLQRGEITGAQAAEMEKPPPMKFIFSIRSDMLHFMDELSEQIPYILRSRYQLFGLSEEQATEAIVTPASLTPALSRGEGGFASPPFEYSPEALTEMLSVLSKNKEVESFQLQAVCQAIEEKVMSLTPALSKGEGGSLTPAFPNREGVTSPSPLERAGVRLGAGGRLITPDFYGGREGIDSILEESYNRRLDGLAEHEEAWPHTARRLLEDALVNRNDRRQSVDVDELLGRPGVTPALLDELERQRLVRKEPRLDSFYYEISHDTWLKPILKSKKIWLEAEEKRRLEAEAEEARRREAEALRREKEAEARKRKANTLAAAAGLAALLAMLAAGWAFFKTEEANEQRELAEKNQNRADTKTLEAEQNLKKAKEEEARTTLALIEVEKEKNATEAQRKEALKNLATAKEQTRIAESRLNASKMMAAKKLPENFDGLVLLDSLNCEDWEMGSISGEIGKLTRLKKLNLSGNLLKVLPPEIGKLEQLRTLDVSWNEGLSVLPPEIGKLEHLQSLDLYNNRLTALPPEIGKLEHLQSLDLYNNQLTALPPEIGNLEQLQSLNLINNELTALPPEIGKLEHLQSLDLASNRLTALPPEIGNLEHLQSLHLYNNQLKALPPEIKNLKALKELDLTGNPLKKEDIEALRQAMPWCKIKWR